MNFLNKETEALLKECIDNSGSFPNVLAKKFEGLSTTEDSRLRARIEVLVNNGYFSKLQWADNVPWFGSITEKGFDYFHEKEVFIRAKLRNQPGFILLDEESEKALSELNNHEEDQFVVHENSKQARILEHLERQGYISFRGGLSWMLDGSCAGVVTVTQSGKTYLSDKETLIEEILITDPVPLELPRTAMKEPIQKAGNRGKKYQVFISSTYEDLKEERAAVCQTLLDLGCIPVGMEQFPASGMSQMDYIKKMLETCDYYILILAGRYGSIDPTDGVGYTEKEYDYAGANRIPVMSFLCDDIGKLPNEKCEKTDAGREALMRFRAKVSTSMMIKKYSSKESLQTVVAISLQQCIRDFPAVGWVRADGIDTDASLAVVLDKYMKEHATTTEDIDALLDKKLSAHSGPKIRVETNETDCNTLIIE